MSDHGVVAWRPQAMKQKPRSRANRKKAKTVLRLPDLEFAKAAVLNSLTNPDAQRGYRHAIDEFVDWYCSEDRRSKTGSSRSSPCAKLCQTSGGELEQIQFLLGHVSVQTTERYLGNKQRIRSAVNDQIGIEPILRSAGFC